MIEYITKFRDLSPAEKKCEITELVEEINNKQAKEFMLDVSFYNENKCTLWVYGRPYNKIGFLSLDEIYFLLRGFSMGWNSYEP